MRKNYPLVSVITPTYNHELYIEECIRSVLAQSYKGWEMIVIDDKSTDKTFEIAKKYARKDKRIRIIKHAKNWGINKLKDTYDQALRESKGELIAILEGDDFWPADKLDTQVKFFSDNKIVLSFGNCLIVNNKSARVKLIGDIGRVKKFTTSKNKLELLSSFLDLISHIIPSTVVVKKRALENIGGFAVDSSYPFVDIPTFIHLCNEGDFLFENKTLGYYRKHVKSSWFKYVIKTNSLGNDELWTCFVNFINENKNIYGKIHLSITDNLFSPGKIFKKKDKRFFIYSHKLIFSDRFDLFARILNMNLQLKPNKKGNVLIFSPKKILIK